MNAEASSPRGQHHPELELIAYGRTVTLSPARLFVVGRGPEADLHLDRPSVSRRHLLIEARPDGWQLTDHSRNGTFIDGSPVGTLPVRRSMTLRLGTVTDGATIELRIRSTGIDVGRLSASGQGRLSTVHPIGPDTIRIGRLPDSDVVLDDLLVSRRHAELRRSGSGRVIVDLDSPNGTFVNGQRITTSPVGPDDVIGIGRSLLQLDGDRLVTFVDNGQNTFEVDGLTVTTASGKTLLHSVGFALSGKTLLAVIGPSGAGKSTLLNALTGARFADAGSVRYAGRDLYADYDELRHRIALVPQDDVLHTQLTVQQALGYAARLRFPTDTSAQDRRQRVQEVVNELGLGAQARQRITSLSGGQRKRTSVALELLTKPSLLFLDEPTSGLDPGMDRSVMNTLRGLADGGRTVVIVTHSITNLEVCDKVLVLASGGWVAYFGPPTEALRYFDEKDFTGIFLRLEKDTGEGWAHRFRQSANFRLNRPSTALNPGAESPGAAPRQQPTLTQWAVLTQRYLAAIAADRQYVGFLAALPLALSLLAWAVPGSAGLSVDAALAEQETQPRQLLLILIIGAALMGTAAAMRELVKERAIYRRERAIGLSIGAYLASKILVLTVIVGVQTTVFTLLGLAARNGPDGALLLGSGIVEVLVAAVGVGVVSMLAGLLISALIDNADRGMPLLVLAIMIQLILCGGMFGVYDRVVLEQVSWFVPARWGFSMAAATADVGRLPGLGAVDPLWEHSAGIWLVNACLLGTFGVIMTVLIHLRIRKLDPARGSRR